MLNNKFPQFTKGRILKQEALDSLRDYPREVVEILCSDFTNGIISGFHVRYEMGEIYVGRGILKHGQTYYMLKEETGLPCRRFGTECSLRLVTADPVPTADFVEHPFQIELVEYREPGEGEYELGRFWLEEGAYLRVCRDYRNFQDAGTQVNTLRIMGRIHAGRNHSTLSPALLQCFGREVIQAKGRTSLDEAFCMVCLNQERVEWETISNYLSASGKPAPAEGKNEELYASLLEIWKCRQGAAGVQGWTAGRSSKRTLIE